MYKLYTDQSFFFRGNGAFNAGVDDYAQGVFPPNPHTLYGALRTSYIEKYGSLDAFINGDMAEEIGTPETHGKLRINIMLMSINDDIYIPLPQDCQVVERDDKLWAKHLNLCKGDGFESDQSEYRFVAPNDNKSISSSNKWLNIDDWLNLSQGKDVAVVTTDAFIVSDIKTGIAIEHKTALVRKGMLYQQNRQYLRDGVSILVDIDLPRPLNHVSLGNKRIWWQMIENNIAKEKWNKFLQDTQIIKQILKGNAVRLSLLTPSQITRNILSHSNHLRFNNELVIQSVIDHPIMVGGWDMHRQRPKPRIPMLSAGSTFILPKPDKDEGQWLKKIQQSVYTDVNKQAGYGRILLSPIKGEVFNEND